MIPVRREVLAALLVFAVPAGAQQNVARVPTCDHLEVSDLRRLAGVLRTIDNANAADAAATVQRDYLGEASAGLRAYARNYNVTGETIVTARAAHRAAYADMNALADSILSRAPKLIAACDELRKLFPEAAFPTVWFVAGHYGPGGLAQPEGALIAAERFAANPADIEPLVLHELAHIQQARVQGLEVFQRVYRPGRTLLGLAIREGSAELIAELTTGHHINAAAQAYGLDHEAELWSRFRADMRGSATGDWMFVRPASGLPQDLGYWIGYRIAKAYYDRAERKDRAIRDILGASDFEAFLQMSGYAGRQPH